MATWYLVRVELVGVEKHSDLRYTTLHEKMTGAGFHKTVTYNNVVYKLPPAEYTFASETTNSEDVCKLAVKTAETLVPKPQVRALVAKTTNTLPGDLAFSNLEK